MPGRTENSVKTRYHSLQRQEARGRGWTKEEDTTLLNATLVFGREWSKVVKQLPGRSRGQLKKRFAALTQHNPTLIRQVQTVEEQLEKGIIVAPNPPPPPIQPMGAQSLQANLIAQQEGKKATHAPVVSPYVPNSITQNPNQQQTSQQQQQQQWSMHQQQEQQMKQKGMKQRYGSSWMNNFSADSGLPEFSNVQGGRPQQQQHFDPSFVSGYNQQQQHQQNVGGAQANYDFTDSAQQQGVWGMPPSQKVKAQNLKREGQPVNNPILDKILNEQQQQNDYNQVQQMQQQRNKGMKQYSSWGELGNTDLNAIFAADTTTGTAGVPAVMRTGSNKKLGNKMSSSNWGAAVPQQLGTYETGGDLKNFLNML